MTKKIYLYIYFLTLVSFFYLKPFGYFVEMGRGAPFLLFELLWLWYGTKFFVKRPLKLYKKTHSLFIILFFISILPSIYMAYHLFHQGLLQSVISYRNLLLFLAIPAFLKMEFSENNIIKACLFFSVTSIVVSLFQTMNFSFLFVYTEKMAERVERELISKDEILAGGVSGIELVLIPLYYYCQKLYNHYSIKSLFIVVGLFAIVFLGQNRSSLFPAAAVVCLTLFFSDMKPRYLKFLIILIVCAGAMYLMKDKFVSLMEETSTQLTSTYDPRVVAMAYFLDLDRMSLGEILFGTGNISFKTSSYVMDLQEAHIHYSDVGFVGFWSQFGILPIILFLYYLFKGLFNKQLPGYLRITAAHILICGVTISYFEIPIHMIWFILFYYLMCYHYVLNQDVKKRGNALKRDLNLNH